MLKLVTLVAALAAASIAAPADGQQRQQRQQQQQVNQRSSYELGPLWSVSMIDVEDGQFENYMDWLSQQWRSNQAFAKQQGWLLDYHILGNENRRPGEPDLYLITRFKDYPSAAENERREAIMLRRMQTDVRTAEQQSGQRSVMRKQMGSMMLRELPFRK